MRRFANRHLLFVLLICFTSLFTFAAADEWLPIDKQDLAMKDYAPSPGAHAVILYRKIEHNDIGGWEKHYYRIKILDEEGKSQANVETEMYDNNIQISDLMARTIHADGTIVPFDGKVTDKLVAKYKGAKVNTKVFSLPDVQVGSIVEYRYILKWNSAFVYDSGWDVQQNLPTRDADFSTRYDTTSGYSVSWRSYHLDKTMQPKDNKGTVALTMHNIPPLEKEEYMPPEGEIRARVEFTYSYGDLRNPDDYWKERAKAWYQAANDFMNKKKAAQNEVAALTSANDTPDTKLQKLYTRVQKLRNLTYEHSKSEKEQEREKLKDSNNIEDVLKHGYGYHNELVRTFVALARAAGFDATLIRVTERDQYFHHKELSKFSRYDTELAIVTIDGKESFLDPGVPFCPYGLLSWEDTATWGLLLNKEGAVWKRTPEPLPTESMQRRVANLELDRDGNLAGELQVTFEGQDALYQRLAERESDEAERKKDLEDMLKRWLPAGSTIQLAKVDDWSSASDKFVIEAKVSVPNFGSATGKRLMVPASLFPGSDKHAFQHARRVNAVYLRNPYREFDQVVIKVPEPLKVETLPQAQQIPAPFADLQFATSQAGNQFTVDRLVIMKGYYYTPEQFPYLRAFLDRVKSTGEEQVVLRAAAK